MAQPRKNRMPVKSQTHGRRMTSRAPIQAPSKQRRSVSYIFHIRKVRTSLRPKFRMSTKARSAMSSFVRNLCDKIVIEAGKQMLREHRKIILSKDIKSAISFLMPRTLLTKHARDIKSAISFLMPRTLTKHSLSKDNKALGNYNLRKSN